MRRRKEDANFHRWHKCGVGMPGRERSAAYPYLDQRAAQPQGGQRARSWRDSGDEDSVSREKMNASQFIQLSLVTLEAKLSSASNAA